jgi:hypothetical protein
MTQPKFAPISIEDQVRDAYRLRTPAPWTAARPAELRPGPVPQGRGFGVAGPDQGYALLLAHRLAARLVLGEGEVLDDALAGCVAIAMRRAAVFGRAPVLVDLELACTLTGYLGEPPADLVSWRAAHMKGLSHDSWHEHELAAAVPESTLRLTPARVAERIAEWRELLGAGASSGGGSGGAGSGGGGEHDVVATPAGGPDGPEKAGA